MKFLIYCLFILHFINGDNGVMAQKEERPHKCMKTNGMASEKPWEDNFRLPRSVHPDHYELYINPNLDTKEFSGKVTIHVTSSEARDYFLVHTKWLTISETKLFKIDSDGPKNISIAEAFEYPDNEFWVIKTTVLVDPGTYHIQMKFSGNLTTGIVGFYYSQYKNADGELRGLATTKFEPTFCRRAFPSFDEPTFKSTYTIHITRPTEGYIALSNMPVKEEIVDPENNSITEVTFEKSVPMVTYLVCFIVCDFTYKETILPSKMPFRVYGRQGKIDDVQYAMDVGQNVLQYYEQMFDLPFPLPKSDMAAIPDYSSGATEHWGIITFRESNLFYNQNISSAVNQQRVCTVVTHEMAHQWFGNLVTLNWWNDLWLNEGFASYIESKGADHIHPDWDMPIQFSIDNLQRVFGLDSKLSSHPIVQVVETPDQINAMFDLISYQKGASVLRMLEDFLGESVFQSGVNSFLKKYAYDNAVTQDLWDELTAAWQKNQPKDKNDVGEIMDTWTIQMGYPVVSVNKSSSGKVVVTQQRFLQDPTADYDPNESDYHYKWDIPITFITSDSPNNSTTAWLYREQDNCELDVGEVDWYKINANQKGYYRVNYDSDTWDKLEKACKDKSIGPADRASLYDDAFSLADAALLDYKKALNISRSLVVEDHYVPWVAIYKHFDIMINLLLETDATQPFKDYVQEVVSPIYTDLGWENNGTHLQKLLRNQVVSLACFSGLDSCLDKAASLLQSWIDDATQALPLGTKRQVYRRGLVKAGSQENWDTLWNRCLLEQDAAERDNLYYGLANSQDEAILTNYITLAQDEDNVRSQDFLKLIKYISSNPAGSDLAWSWVRSNWDWLINRYGIGDRYLGQLIPDITMYFATEQRLQEMEDFFTDYSDAGAGALAREQALETVKFNIRWLNSYKTVILEWLQDH